MLLLLLDFLFLGLLWVTFEPKRYESNILITIGRTQSKTVAPVDYQYDNFYRLQADERFGDTLVRLLSTPQVTSDIFAEAGCLIVHQVAPISLDANSLHK